MTLLLLVLIPGMTATSANADPPVVASDSMVSQPSPTYMQLVARKVSAEFRYPQKAQYDAEEGYVVVRIRIARDGSILGKELATRCKWDLLNAEALDIFDRIGHLPPVPDDIYPQITTFEFTIPFNFTLK